MRSDFWLSCGHHLVERTEAGGLAVTDALLAAWLARPELLPPDEACPAERALHASLLANPRRTVAGIEVAALADADARENWQAWLAFRDHLLAHPTLEASYAALFRGDVRGTPPLFIAQIAQLILRNILDAVEDPIRIRAAELFFRSQRVSTEGGNVLLADEETVESAAGDARAGHGGLGVLGQIMAEAGTAVRSVELDVLSPENASLYWARSDRFDTVLDLTFGREGQDALARVIEAWVKHLLGIVVSVQPLQTIHDEAWAWYVGLDAEATAISNRLWNGEKVGPEDLGRVLALFRLEFENPAEMLPRVAGRPVYLSLAMTPGKTVRLKPQNLLAGLPLRQAQAA
jgi:predicted nucleic acid-binding protein